MLTTYVRGGSDIVAGVGSAWVRVEGQFAPGDEVYVMSPREFRERCETLEEMAYRRGQRDGEV